MGPEMSANTDRAIIAVDADIMDLAEDFLRRRREAVPTIRGLIDAGDMDRLRRAGHELKGTAGSYGFQELSRTGAVIEDAAIAEDPERARRAVDAMADFLARVTLVAG
jgi:HPt (histidine-containing phosphotransfer) domain-containing protein